MFRLERFRIRCPLCSARLPLAGRLALASTIFCHNVLLDSAVSWASVTSWARLPSVLTAPDWRQRNNTVCVQAYFSTIDSPFVSIVNPVKRIVRDAIGPSNLLCCSNYSPFFPQMPFFICTQLSVAFTSPIILKLENVFICYGWCVVCKKFRPHDTNVKGNNFETAVDLHDQSNHSTLRIVTS